MADRKLAGAAAGCVVAIVLAAGAVATLGLRTPVEPPAVTVAVPPPPASPPTTEQPATAPAVEETPDETYDDETPDAATARDEPEVALAPPARLAVVATGIAWNDELAATAAFRLPPTVTFAVPADLPTAVERLARWRAAGRAVALRLIWRPSAAHDGRAIPLAAAPEVQAARMEAQWAELDGAAAALVVEPEAARALAAIARRVATGLDATVLLGADEPAPPPRAWRVDAGLLGERGLERALDRVVAGTAAGDTLIVLVEIYPALLDRLVAWLAELDERGIALVPLDRLAEERS